MHWTTIRALNGSQQSGFEQLCAQLAHDETPVGARFVRNGTPDGGVECYISLPNGSEWGWQAKYFLSLGDSQWSQLDESVKTALNKYPNLVRQTICLPYDFPDSRQANQTSARKRWNAHVEKWKSWAKAKGRNVEFVFWGAHELLQRLSQPRHAGRLRFWFDARSFDQSWFDDRLCVAIKAAGPRYTPELHVDLPIARDFDALGRTPEFFDGVKSHGRTLREKLGAFGLQQNSKNSVPVAVLTKAEQLSALTTKILERLGQVDFQPTGTLPFSAIADLVDAAYEMAEEFGKDLWDLNRSALANKPFEDQETLVSRKEPFRDWLFHLHSLQSELQSFGEKIREADDLASATLLLLTGEAGSGKTHLLCDVAKKRLQVGRPTVLLMGQMFTSTEAPWSQALRQLDLEGLTAEEFVGALEAAAQVADCRAVVFFDALNEGQGRQIWPSHLAAFLSILERSPWITIGLSVRDAYEETVIPEQIHESALLIKHEGFSSHEYDATKAFFSHYGIELPPTPLLVPEFRNPLFLRTLCGGLVATGQRRLPRGFHGISATFGLYLTAVNRRLASELDYHPKTHLVQRALEAFTSALVEADERWLPFEQAVEVVNSVLPGRDYQKSMYRGLLAEGILLEEPRASGDTDEEVVLIAYDRFADHMVAKIILDQHLDNANPETSFASGSRLRSYWENERWVPPGLLEAMCIQVPERTQREVPDLLQELEKGHWQLARAFRTSLIWRSPESISEATKATMSRLIKTESDLNETLEILLNLASLPGHPMNARFLDKRLRMTSMPERDSWWSTYLHTAWREQGAIGRIVDWAWSDAGSAQLEAESAKLLATALAWMLSTSNRFLRDRATKALVNLLTTRVPLCVDLVERFVNIDDPYIVERVLAVAYGVAMRTQDDIGIEALAKCVFRLVFENGSPPAHILQRDYARGVIERAQYLGLAQECDPKLFRPPYHSHWPHIPTNDEIKHLLPNWDRGSHDSHDNHWSHNRIGRSVMDDDFAFYVIGTNSGRTNWLSLRLDEPTWEPPLTPQQRLNDIVDNLPKVAQQEWQAFEAALEEAESALSTFTRKWFAQLSKMEKGDDFREQWDELSHKLRDAVSKNKKYKQFAKKRDKLWGSLCAVLDESTRVQLEDAIEGRYERVENEEPPRFDLSKIQRYVLWRVFDLGWTKERFGSFDRFAVSMQGRSASKAERIGKKYQWIAFHEILALVADHYQYRDLFGGAEPDDRYEGPWQEYLRDIDPSSTLASTPGGKIWGGHARNWWGDVSYDWDFDIDHTSWIQETNDLPALRDLLLVTSPTDSSRWVNLNAAFDWTQPTPPDLEASDVQRRNFWYIATGYLIRAKDVDSFLSWARDVDFWGRWMPDPPEHYRLFLGEHVWSPAAQFYACAYYGDDGWTTPRNDCPVSVRTAAVELVQESSGFDCSIDEGIRLHFPAGDLIDGLGLRWTGSRADYADRDGKIVIFDPTASDPGPSALLVREDALLAYLEREELAICWAVLGEKRILGQEYAGENRLPALQVTGAYAFGVNGFYGFSR